MKKPINPTTFSICLECKKHQKNCCNDSPRVPLTIEDIERIISLGFKIKDFLIVGEYSKQRLQNDEDWWRNSMVNIKGRLFKINTKKKEDGSCFFLKDGVGCALGEFRPTVCKIYPFWVNQKNEIIYEPGEKEYCYFGKLGISVSDGLKLIQGNEEKIHSYFLKIKDDCIKNKHREIIVKIQK